VLISFKPCNRLGSSALTADVAAFNWVEGLGFTTKIAKAHTHVYTQASTPCRESEVQRKKLIYN